MCLEAWQMPYPLDITMLTGPWHDRHKETCTCRGACCGLNPVPTRASENALLAFRVIREALNRANFLDHYIGHRQYLVLLGFVVEQCRCQDGLLQCPNH